MRMLVSVRDGAEALCAAGAGADFIDLKEPAAGALGGLAPARIRDIVAVLRARHPGTTISATIGDVPVDDGETILRRVDEVGGCGVDLVKVGVPGCGGPAARMLLRRLGAAAWPVVPVFLADDGIDGELFGAACARPFPALMLDTQGKSAGSLFDFVAMPELAALIRLARAAGKPVGLAGALREPDLPGLLALQPDFAGFRSAVCDGARTGTLAGEKVRALRKALCDGHAQAVAPAAGGRPAELQQAP